MENFITGTIMGFREGLEAFLLIAIMIQYIKKLGRKDLSKSIWLGSASGIGISLIIGLILKLLDSAMENAEQFATVWESLSSLVALGLVTTFIIWMIKNSKSMTEQVKNAVNINLSALGIAFLSLTVVAREGAEIAIFSFAGEYNFASVLSGIILALILTVLIFFSLVKVNLKVIFNITLGYLILQAGLLLGYSIHEGLSALKNLGYLAKDNFIYVKAFNLTDTILDHKTGILGVPMYALLGWYSRPEWLQFILQYVYTFFMFAYWHMNYKKTKKE